MIDHRAMRSGITLAELMVVIMVLGVMAAVTGIAFATKRPVAAVDARGAQLAAARDSAIRMGEPVTVRIDVDSSVRLATAYPDGRVVTDLTIDVDLLSGRSAHASR